MQRNKAKFELKETNTVVFEEGKQQPNRRQDTPESRRRYYLKLRKDRRKLPIYSAREKIIDAIKTHDNLVVVGETGSGKTTQIPQYLYEAGFCSNHQIGITQPRRVAAMSVSKRVSEEMNCRLGSKVGYNIRFDDMTSSATRLKFLTDGMLLRECALDGFLSKYRVIILDEAHERTLHTDILFAVLKEIQLKRQEEKSIPNLKVICMSATLEADQFSEYFFNAPVLRVSGRQFPVEIRYVDEAQSDYLDSVVITVFQIHLGLAGNHLEDPLLNGELEKNNVSDSSSESKSISKGADILVFLTGQEEIETARRLIEERIPKLPKTAKNMIITPIYAALPPEQQLKVFEPTPPGYRKIILATNIAETSITIDGIKYVVDTGMVKVREFLPSKGIDHLNAVPISKAEAWQRSGRAGRQQAGMCYRLFTEDFFTNQLEETRVPEILRCNLCTVVLQLQALGVDNLLTFDFMSRPKGKTLRAAGLRLINLGALSSDGKITELGRKMVLFPLDPHYSKVLLSATTEQMQCLEEALTVIAMLCVESIFYVPRKKSNKAEAAKRRFSHHDGDHLTYLEVYNMYNKASNKRDWCHGNFINYRSVTQAAQIRQQLADICYDQLKLPSSSCGSDTDRLCRCLITGFFLNTAIKQPDNTYKSMITSMPVHIHPTSVLHRQPNVECIIYNELIFTKRTYMRGVCRIDLNWLPELAPRHYSSNSTLTGSATNSSINSQSSRQLWNDSKQPKADSRTKGHVNSNRSRPKSKSVKSKLTPVKKGLKRVGSAIVLDLGSSRKRKKRTFRPISR